VTTVRTRSQLGAMSRNKGARAERDLVAYLRQVGFGGAERAVRTGYRTAGRVSADPGDITGTPGIVWSVKDAAVERLEQWLDELDAMESAGGIRLLVQKRRGQAIPDKWWCWMRMDQLSLLLDAHHYCAAPVRMELCEAVDLLHLAGYGDPAEVVS
jgi:hypothetical protein